jgi:hypothetical protein
MVYIEGLSKSHIHQTNSTESKLLVGKLVVLAYNISVRHLENKTETLYDLILLLLASILLFCSIFAIINYERKFSTA